MDSLLWLRVQIVRFLLRYNDRREREQEPKPPQPTFVEQIHSPTRRGSIRLHFYTPGGLPIDTSALSPVVVDFHGGGFSSGVPSMDARWAHSLHTTATKPIVVGVEYALAPEHPFPAAIQDAATVLSWLSNEGAQKHHLDPKRFVLSGFSAGGTLVLTTSLWISDEGQKISQPHQLPRKMPVLNHPLRGILSVYPKVDYRQSREPAGSFLTQFLSSTWNQAYADRSPVESPFVSPAAADDNLLTMGLPSRIALYPVSVDALLESCEDFRGRLRALGKHVTGHVEPNAWHAWDKSPISSDNPQRWSQRDKWFRTMAQDVEDMLNA